MLAVIATGTMSAQQAAVTPAETKDANLRAYVELLRSDVRAQKVAFITELMEFTDAEDKAFWPIYREYDVELSKINDERVTGIEEYARNYDKGERCPRRQARHQGARARVATHGAQGKVLRAIQSRRSHRKPRRDFSRSRTSC